jgi:signal transduction histidine kinase
MSESISHIVYVGHNSEARDKLAAMLGPAATDRQPARPFLLLPEIVALDGLDEPLPQADLYLIDLTAVGEKRPLVRFAQLQQQAPQIPTLILVTPEQEALGRQAIEAGAADYLVWGEFEPPLLQHVVQLLLRIGDRRLPLSWATPRQQLIRSLGQTGAFLENALDFGDILDRFLDQLAHIISFDTAFIMFIEDDRGTAVQISSRQPQLREIVQETPLTFTISQTPNLRHVVESKQPLLIPDVQQYPGWIQTTEVAYIGTWMGAPIIVHDNVVALLNVARADPYSYTEQDLHYLTVFAEQAAIAIQNVQLYESTRSSAAELRLATEALRILNADPVFQDAFPAVSSTLKQIAGADAVCLILLNSEDGWDCTLIHHTDDHFLNQAENKVRLNHKAIMERLRAGQPYLSPDLSQHTNPPIDHLFNRAGFGAQASIPLRGKGLLGTITFLWQHKYGINKSQLPLLNQLANAIALAIERSRLFTAVNRQAERMQLLNELGRQISGLLDSHSLSQAVVDFLHKLFDFTIVSILLIDESGEYLVLQAIAGLDEAVNLDQFQVAVGQGLTGRVALTGEPLLANDTRTHSDFVSWPYTRVLSELVLPLWAGDRVLGVLNIDSDQLEAFNENDMFMFTLVADQLAAALEKARLFDETRRRTAELEAVSQISTMLRQANTVDEILALILEQCLSMVDGQLGSVFLVEPETGDLVARWCIPAFPELMGRRYQSGQGIAGYVATTGEIYIINDLLNDPLTHILPEETDLVSELQSTIGLPLRAQERIVGVILISLAERHSYSQAEVRLLTAISDIAGSALDRALVLESLEQHVEVRTRELAKANEQLQALDKLKSKFISDMSHELRTPITNLGLYVDLLQQGQPEKQAYYLEVLRKQVARLGQLMEDILSLSRLEMSRERISFRPVDFNQLVRQNIEALHFRVEAEELQLTHELEPDLPPVFGEPNQLAQIVSNLLSNAINYTRQGEVLVRTFRSDRHTICFEVQDSGMGIPEEEQPFIFQRFYRGQQMGQSNMPGTGLGLAIVQEVVSLHGGRIEFESVVNQGSNFRVWLPAEAMETAVTNGAYHEQKTTLV